MQNVLKRSLCVVTASFLGLGLFVAGCGHESPNRVVVYCSVDDVYSKPILDQLEKETGLDIEPLFDVESAKAAGLANKIRAEHNRPRADVFWASTVLQSQMLANEGRLASYKSPSASDIPMQLKDKEGRWTAMGIRARVLIASKEGDEKNLVIVPANLSGKFAISNPQFGTCSDWSAAYGTKFGTQKAIQLFQDMKKAGVRVLPGNADVASGVADGNLVYGVTDSDDFLAQRREGKKVFLMKTTQNNVLVPGCASMLAGAPHPENARKLLDALLSAQTEQRLVKGMPGVFSVRKLNDAKNWQSGGEDFSYVKDEPIADYSKWRTSWEALRKPLADLFTP